ncbi:hypothetical protein A3A70_00860 [candidate division WWE3 bacterium RIFCSPLOWO2_01_FULL_42_11]|uniref:Glycosyl transferase family 1 domain-containing protein n=1 Tax=candidate division WWE3 bacterium RIFCSPLOWO2_01_FULL_42_11 TaxID=1802627 RepID=A0A1F4VPU7_UNCKA|nr:MAG: hypothetical protein A3A70_00860 [candidate division WWE3 bacterium RIFCSPLOWO2_01_FULL_42_11]
MNIGIDAHQAMTEVWGGVENYSFNLINALIKLNNDHRLIIFKGTENARSLRKSDHTRFVKIPLPRLWSQIGLALATYPIKLDVLFIPVHTIPIFKRPGLPTVVSVHDLYSLRHPEDYPYLKGFYLNWFSKNNIKRASRIIAVSEFTKKEILQLFKVPDSKISVIPEAHDPTIYKVRPQNEISLHLEKYDLKKPFVLFLGTLNKRKNVSRLIEAFAQLEKSVFDYDLVIVGKDSTDSENIKALVEKLGVTESVKFLGFIPDLDVSALMNACDVVAYTSLYEGFGQVILEAMACGAPVITSNTTSMPEVAGDCALLICPTDTKDLKEKLEKVLGSPELRTSMSKKGLEHLKRFSWEISARKTLDLLEETYENS